MSQFLSHEETKPILTKYLAEKILQYNCDSAKLVIVSASGYTSSNSSLLFEDNNHEEGDTLLIRQAVLATQRNPNAQLMFFSPDTDVLVLAITNCDQLSQNSFITMVSGLIAIYPIW